MMPALRTVAHLHSRISYDGELGLADLATRLARQGVEVALVTEHNDSLTPPRLVELRDACAMASSARILMIPGIELRCERNLHLLSLGAVVDLPVGVPLILAASCVREAGGVAVLAHPPRRSRADIPTDGLALCHGAEVWNGKRDARWFAARSELAWIEARRRDGLPLWAFAGLDFHGPGDPLRETLVVDADERSAAAVLAALRGGRFRIAVGPFVYRSDGGLDLGSAIASTIIEETLYPAWVRTRRFARSFRHSSSAPGHVRGP